MPKINVYLPDELAEAVKESGLPVSAICQRALETAVRRITGIREAVLNGQAGEDSAGRLAHFTARARTGVKLAVDLARAQGAAAVGTEHLLAGLLDEGGNLALQVLQVLEIEPRALRRELDRASAAAPATAATPVTAATAAPESDGTEPLRFGPDAAAALELAVGEALALSHNYIGCEHLLLGLVAEPDGRGGSVLRTMGAEQRLTRRAVSAALAGYQYLHAQTTARAATAATAALPADAAQKLAGAIQAQLRPLIERLDRLEARIDAAD